MFIVSNKLIWMNKQFYFEWMNGIVWIVMILSNVSISSTIIVYELLIMRMELSIHFDISINSINDIEWILMIVHVRCSIDIHSYLWIDMKSKLILKDVNGMNRVVFRIIERIEWDDKDYGCLIDIECWLIWIVIL